VALVVLGLLTLAIAGYNFSANLFLARIDALTYYEPWYQFLGDRLRAGELPGWLPFTMSGAPFAGDPQSGWFYMPVMVIFSILPSAAGFKALILFHLLLAAGSAYAFARVIGLNVPGSMAAAAAFAFTGMIERARCCTIHVEVAVWIPVAFLGIELAARARSWGSRAAWWLLTGIAVSQMIAGWIGQGAAYGLIATGAYAFYRIVLAPSDQDRELRTRFRHLVAAGAVIGLVTGVLAAAAILPRLAVVDRSNLAGGKYNGVGESAARTGGWRVETMLDRLLTADDSSGRFYAGGATVALAIVGVALAGRRFRLAFFVPYALVILVLTLRETVLHRLFYLIPSFQQFHEHRPDRVLTVFPLAPAILAGAAVTMLPSWRQRSRLAPLVAFLPLALAFLFWVWRPGDDPISRDTILAIAVVSLALAAALKFSDRRVLTVSLVILIAAVVWDPFGRQVVLRPHEFDNPSDKLEQAYESDHAAGAFLQQKAEAGETARFFGYDPAMLVNRGDLRTYHVSYSNPKTVALLAINRGISLGLEDIQGYNPIQIQRYVDFLVKVNGQGQSYHAANVLFHGATSPLLNLLDVGYIVIPRDVPPGRPDLLHLSQRYPTVYADDRVRVLHKTDSLPRAWIVHSAQTATDSEALDLLASSTLDPSRVAILPSDAALPALAVPADPAAERVNVTGRTPDRITLSAELTQPGLVVLSEIWDPDWKVLVDGKPVELYRANTILRAIPLPAGTHSIELQYESKRLLASAVVSGFGWLAILLGAIVVGPARSLARQRRRPRHDEEVGLDTADRAGAGRPREKPRPLVDAPSAQVERGHAQSKAAWLKAPAPLGQRGEDE
jgi:hypothetical protein